MLEIQQLSKNFGTSFQMGPIQLKVSAQDTIALLGKNGAGKTTLFQILTGNLDPTEGKVEIKGQLLTPDSYQIKRRIGYLPQNLGLPKWVTPKDLLHYAADLLEVPEIPTTVKKTLEFWDCTEFAHKPFAACSYGMQKRVGLALASFHDPDLLILDEPFSGLDIYHTRALEETIQRRSKTGKATIMSTHVALHAARLCNRALTMDQGRCNEFQHWLEKDYPARITLIEDFFFAKH